MHRAEEEHHFVHDLGQCVGNKPEDKGNSQCGADIAHINCLRKALRECAGNKVCLELLRRMAQRQAEQCKRSGKGYEPKIGEAPKGYDKECTAEEKRQCQDAYKQFRDAHDEIDK